MYKTYHRPSSPPGSAVIWFVIKIDTLYSKEMNGRTTQPQMHAIEFLHTSPLKLAGPEVLLGIGEYQ